jgi:iron complex outermembrane recepter protein
MKKLTTILTAVFLAVAITGFSAKTPIISGQVKDENKQPYQGVTVSLFRAKDTSLVKAAFTNSNGEYIFEGVKDNKYIIGVSATGYKKYLSGVIEISGADFALPVIVLEGEVKGLKEVTVTGRKPLFEQKPDKMVVNVDASPSNAGANALEVLEKSPGITVDKDGNISLKGKAGVQVFMDGKPAYLSGQDLVNYLRNLSGAQLEQIEIMTNPPAKYDAAGNSGIINIKTKKNKQLGYNVTTQVGYTQGIYARNNQNINFNYRKNKLNLFGTLSRNERTRMEELSIQRKFLESNTKDVKFLFNQTSRMKNSNTSNSVKLGADYYLSKKTTIGAVVNGFYNPGRFNNRSDIFRANSNNQLIGKTYANSNSSNLWQNFSANTNFRHVFDTTGKELTADLDYIHYNVSNSQNLSNYYFDAFGSMSRKADTLYGTLPQLINIYSAKTDYIHPLKKGAKFEAGLKIAYVKSDANAVYDTVNNNILLRDYGRSNHFIYDERINAAYVSYSRPLSKKISAQLGLRVENTTAHGNSLGKVFRNNQWVNFDTTFRINYTQLFPTAYVQYTASEKHSWVLNYGRRIRRPDYESLNPFVEFLDIYTFEQGNPNLRPQFSHNVEFSHTYKGFLTTTLNYTQTNNIIQQVLEQNTDRQETFVKQANIARQRQWGVAVSAYKQIKNFGGNVYVNVYNNLFEGLIDKSFVTLSATTAVFSASANYKFKKGITAEVNGFYRTPGFEGVFNIRPLGAFNWGVSVPVLKTKGTIRFSVRDMFWTQRPKGSIQYGDVDAAFQNINDSRTFGVNFTYRLSKGKINGGKRKTGGAADEQNRVKGGE